MASLLPNGKQQYFGTDGLPLVGGKLFTYQAGTTTPKATFTTAAADVPNTNPIILDGRGEAQVFWSGSYKVVLKDSLDNIIWTVDNITEPFADIKTTPTGSLIVPSGNTAQRDNPASSGYFRYNVDNQTFEGFYEDRWISLIRSVNGDDVPADGNINFKTIGGQDVVGEGEIEFKTINSFKVTGQETSGFPPTPNPNKTIDVQSRLIPGVTLKNVNGVSLLGSGDLAIPGSAGATLFTYLNIPGGV